jgi:hypothetical protein
MNIIIPANKKKFPGPLVIGLLASGFSLSRIIANSHEAGAYGPLPFFSYLVLFVFVSIFSIQSLADYLKTCFDKNATLIISDKGLADNLSIFSCGELHWNEIAGVHIVSRIDTNLLIILVKDPASVVSRQSLWKKMVLNSFFKNYGSPVVISERKLPLPINELRDILYKRIH